MIVISYLKKPWLTVLGLFIGILFGIFQPSYAIICKTPGDLYLALLQMCVLPLIVTAIIISFYNLVNSHYPFKFILRLFLFMSIGMISVSFLGSLIGQLLETGILTSEAKTILGQYFYINESDILKQSFNQQPHNFIQALIPKNIFNALSEDRILEVVFFSAILGMAMGLIQKPLGASFYTMCEALYEAIFKIISWILIFLPIGIFCIIASFMASIGLQIISALLYFTIGFVVAVIFLILLYCGILSFLLKKTPVNIFFSLKKTYFVILGTQSFVASIPVIIQELRENFQVDTDLCKLTVPLGMMIHRQGIALYFSLLTITLAQIYDIYISFSDLFFIVLSTAFLSMSAIGPPLSTITILSIILNLFHIPVQSAYVFFAATAPLLSPFIILLSAQGVIFLTLIFAHITKKKEKNLLPEKTDI